MSHNGCVTGGVQPMLYWSADNTTSLNLTGNSRVGTLPSFTAWAGAMGKANENGNQCINAAKTYWAANPGNAATGAIAAGLTPYFTGLAGADVA